MTTNVVLIDKSNKGTELPKTDILRDEKWFQNMLIQHPSLLPTAEIDDTFAPLFFLGDEIRSANSCRIDNLYITPRGHLVIVETKLWRNPEAVREVVAQVQNYASDMQKWSYDRLNKEYKKRNNNIDIFSAMLADPTLKIDCSEHNFIDKVNRNLKQANFLLMIVGDGIREGLPELIDFVNHPINGGYHIALCQIQVFESTEQKIITSNLIAKTVELGVFRIQGDNIHFESTTKISHDATMPVDLGTFITEFTTNNPEISPQNLQQFIDDIAAMEPKGFQVKFNSNSLSIAVNNITVAIIKPTEIMVDVRKLSTHKNLNQCINALVKALKPVIIQTRLLANTNQLSRIYLSASVIKNNKDLFISALETFAKNSK